LSVLTSDYLWLIWRTEADQRPAVGELEKLGLSHLRATKSGMMANAANIMPCYRVPSCKVLSDRYASETEHKREFHNQQ
jgi:hypothetical protein